MSGCYQIIGIPQVTDLNTHARPVAMAGHLYANGPATTGGIIEDATFILYDFVYDSSDRP